jgi:hypothetical protein
MRKYLLALICAATVAGALVFSTTPAQAINKIWTGQVVHVSTENIKVHNSEGNVTLSFLVLPRFDQIFSDDGKTTYQMRKLLPGTWVTVYYDQNLLGARHADKIIVLRTGLKMKS